MANEIPEYFLSRNWDFPPNGPIKLGNVITSLKEPHRPLVTIRPADDLVIHSTKALLTIEKESSRSGGFTFLTTFLSGLLGLGVDAGVDVEKSSGKHFVFDRVDTDFLNTANDDGDNTQKTAYQTFMEKCTKAPAVLRYLERTRFRKHIYIITGVKTVSGARYATEASKSTEALTGVELDGTILSGGVVPLGGGPEVRGGRTKRLDVSWDGSSDFILAFKVSKIRADKDGNIKSEKEYLKGAFLERSTNTQEPAQQSFKVTEEHDAEEGFSAVNVHEGDTLIAFGVPYYDEDIANV